MQTVYYSILTFILCWGVFGFVIGISMLFASGKSDQKSVDAKRGKVKIATTVFAILSSSLLLRFINISFLDELTIIPVLLLPLLPELLSYLYFGHTEKK